MLYRFKSKNTGDIIMLEPNGRHVLEIIGKAPGPTGIILPAEMPAAIAALQAAMVLEEAAGSDKEDAKAVPGKAIGLRQRAHPFIEMLRMNHKAGQEVVWGV
jgi:hypothetical protein